MPGRLSTSDVEMSSDEDRKNRKKSAARPKSRSPRDRSSRSRSRDRKKHKKHKKEKKKRRHRSESAGDTGNEGGETPTDGRRADTTTPPPAITGRPLVKYESDEEEEEEEQQIKTKDEKKERTEYRRFEEEERKEEGRGSKRRRSRSRNRRSRSREDRKRDKRDKYSRDEDRKTKEERRGREEERRGRDDDVRRGGGDEEAVEAEEANIGDGGGSREVISLSIEETNKLRAKLGMKPLNINEKNEAEEEDDDGTKEGTLIPGDRNKTRHLPAEHWGEKANSLKLREKLTLKKERRNILDKLAAVKGLGDSDSDDDAEKWIQKQKSKVEAKKEAEKLAKQMAELDDEFGVGELVTEKLQLDRAEQYTAKHLRGMRVEHSVEHFSERETILTLKDVDILDEKYEDVLVNVNIMDTERTKKNLENIKAGKEGYKAYDQEEVDELTGEVRRKGILYQYNEEIEGAKKESFTLQTEGQFSEEENRARELAKIRQKLKLGNMETLETPQLRLASDYYNDEELAAFKKPKTKKKKIRKKMLKADDLIKMQNPETLLPTDFGGLTKRKRIGRIIDDDEDGGIPLATNYDDLPVVEDLSGVTVDDEDMFGVNYRLRQAQKLKLKQQAVKSLDLVAAEILAERQSMKMEEGEEEEEGRKPLDDLVLEETEEFCRNLGESMTYEGTGMGEAVSEELLDFEMSLTGKRPKDHDHPERGGKAKKGGWEAVEGEVMETNSDDEEEEEETRVKAKGKSGNLRPAILEDEALAGQGMGAALKMAMQMGYLEKEQTKQKSSGLQELKAQKYSIEDKSRDYEEDDRKRRGRDRGGYGGGPTTTFAEKKGYKPEVTLEYIDDSGRVLNSKEAFRYLSHKFHGKTSGKLKTEKRQRKVLESQLMQKMSSTDTPLQTLHKQLEKSKELATPYLVLSGNKQLSSLKK